MFRRTYSPAIGPVLILASGLIVFLWLSLQHAPPERTRVPPSPPLVEVIEFKPGNPRFQIQVSGNVVPSREVTISAQVSGNVVAKSDHLESGRYVEHGSVLLRIDPASYQLEVQEVASELKQVQQDLRHIAAETKGTAALVRIAERKLELATQERARMESLFGDAAVSETSLNEARQLELQANNALRALQNTRDLIPIRRGRLDATLTLANVRQQQAQLRLDRTRIVAPINGIITVDGVEVGDFVQAGDVLLAIEETAAAEVECNLRTDDLYWLWNSDLASDAEPQRRDADQAARPAFEIPRVPATVTYRIAGDQFQWQGVLSRYHGGGIDQATRTVPCRVLVSGRRRKYEAVGPPALMRGMYVTVTLTIKPRIHLWRIPLRAVQPNRQIWTVHDNKLCIQEVKPARVLSSSMLIRAEASTLKPGDRIIVSQLATAFDGMQVRIAAEAAE